MDLNNLKTILNKILSLADDILVEAYTSERRNRPDYDPDTECDVLSKRLIKHTKAYYNTLNSLDNCIRKNLNYIQFIEQKTIAKERNDEQTIKSLKRKLEEYEQSQMQDKNQEQKRADNKEHDKEESQKSSPKSNTNV